MAHGFVFVSPIREPEGLNTGNTVSVLHREGRNGFATKHGLIVAEQRAARNIHKDPMSPEAN